MASRSLLASASRAWRYHPGGPSRLSARISFPNTTRLSALSFSTSISTQHTPKKRFGLRADLERPARPAPEEDTSYERRPERKARRDTPAPPPQKKRFGLRQDVVPRIAQDVEPEPEPRPVASETDGAASAVPEDRRADAETETETETEASAPAVQGAEAWTRAGIHPAVAKHLVSVVPEAVAPTPGQRAFIMTVERGGTDVYFKDYMGRGKTFALALTALSLACRGGHQTVMLFPTPHLAQQVSDLLVHLAPQGKLLHTLVTEHGAHWDAPIIVATPRVLNEANMPDLPNLTHIFLDEPDTMFGPLPGRYMSAVRLAKHPINKHPPPVIPALNALLNIKARKGERIDFSGRRTNVRTVWASATFGPAMRRFVYGRGWALSSKTSGGESQGLVDLNFTAGSSDNQRQVVDMFRQISKQGGVEAVEPSAAPKPQHFALVVGPTGRMAPLTIDHIHQQDERYGQRGPKDELVELTLVEAMAFIHATSPPPPGTYALVLPPRSGSLKALAAELTKLGLDVAPLVPEALDGGIRIPQPDEQGLAPVLISPRAAMAGLHLPQLHTVYMLNGLDMASVTPAQMKLGGRHDRETQYAVIAGRLGRMGTEAAYVPGHPQRVISLVSAGSYEQHALEDLFAGRLNPEKSVMFHLGEWTGEL